jgi:hypothetical protein
LSAETTDRNTGPTAAIAAPAPTLVDGLKEAMAVHFAIYAADLSVRWVRVSRGAVRFARRQTEFTQVARFILAIPFVVGAPTYVAFDARPPALETVVERREVPPPSAVQPAAALQDETATRVAPADPRVSPPADAVAGPRIRAICSRASQTVFLDDRAEADASANWREEVALKHPGAVCAFTTRFGVADPQFRAIEANSVVVPPKSAPSAEDSQPIFVKTIPVPSELLAPPDPRAGSFAIPYDAPDPAKDQIERALEVLAVPKAAAGARVSSSVAQAATLPDFGPHPLPRSDPRRAVQDEAPTSLVDHDERPAKEVDLRNESGVSGGTFDWRQGTAPLLVFSDTSSLLRGAADVFVPIGAYGQDAGDDFRRLTTPVIVWQLGRPVSSNVSELQDLERMVTSRRFSWVRPDGLTIYPPALALPFPPVGRHSSKK